MPSVKKPHYYKCKICKKQGHYVKTCTLQELQIKETYQIQEIQYNCQLCGKKSHNLFECPTHFLFLI